MNFWAKMQNIDRRLIYALLAIVVSIPMIKPLGLPLSYTDTTLAFFDELEKLQPGDKVLMSLDYAPSGAADVHPQTVAVSKHLIQKGVKIVYVSFWAAGPMFAEQIMQPYLESGELIYGEDVVNLGYIPGGTSAIRSFGFEPLKAAPKDLNGKDTVSMPIMQGVKDCRDFDVVIDFVAGSPGTADWVQQVQGPLGIKLLAGAVTVEIPSKMPYIQSGQIKGLLQGLRGAAEYEVLSGNVGVAAAGMDAQSLGHLLIITLIVTGNIAYFVTNKKTKSDKQ